MHQRVAALPLPAPHLWTAPYDLQILGVGGTGVVTVGAPITMAADLDGKQASVLDFMGFAQKGGAVSCFVRLADQADRLHQVRIDAQQADAVPACDLAVAASPDALLTLRHGWQRGLVPVGLAALQRAITLNDLAARTIQAFHAQGRPAQPGPG